jgi:hypothetical protein
MATITVEVTQKQLNRWRTIAGGKPDLGTFLARSADFYVARLQARQDLARRLERQGKL